MVKSLGKAKNYSVSELVAKAETLVDQCQPDLAVRFYERALLKDPNNTALLDMVGELSTELNNPERALEAFQKSIAVAPAQNPGKWFYVAQLVAGEEAEKYSLQGIQYLLQELQQMDQQAAAVDRNLTACMTVLTPALYVIMMQSNDALIVKKQLCDAYCGLGELYMTDLCDEDNAEERCETYFTEAMKYDVGLPEPTQAFANLRLTQQRTEEAIPLLEETYRRLNENCDENTLPPLEFRVFTGKLLIEVEKYEEACDVLEGVMQEDDENAELWFLVGTCYRAMDDLSNALEFFERCAKMLKKLKKEFQDEFQLQDQLESVEESIVSIKEAIANRPEGEDDEESDDDGESEDTGGEMEDVDMEE